MYHNVSLSHDLLDCTLYIDTSHSCHGADEGQTPLRIDNDCARLSLVHNNLICS